MQSRDCIVATAIYANSVCALRGTSTQGRLRRVGASGANTVTGLGLLLLRLRFRGQMGIGSVERHDAITREPLTIP